MDSVASSIRQQPKRAKSVMSKTGTVKRGVTLLGEANNKLGRLIDNINSQYEQVNAVSSPSA